MSGTKQLSLELEETNVGQHKNPEWLREQYHRNGLTMAEIGDKAGVSASVIYRQMEEFGIGRGDHPSPRTNRFGHRELEHKHREERYTVMIHRLHATLLVDELGELGGVEVHHKNGCPFDNRLENYELLDPSEHWEITRESINLPPRKGLCTECDNTSYFFDRDAGFCPYCGSEYGSQAIQKSSSIDWKIDH